MANLALRTRGRALALAAAMLMVSGAPAFSAFDDPVDLSAAGKESTFPKVAIDDAGDSLTIWRREGAELRLQARFRTFAGTLGAIENISSAGVDVFGHNVAMDADGDAVIVWYREIAGGKRRIQARRRTSGGTLGPVLNLSPANENSSSPVVRMTPNGRALVAWSVGDGTNTRIKARAMAANGTWGEIEDISGPFIDTAGSPFDAALNQSAKGMIVWSDGTRVRGRTRAANGTLGAIKNLSAAGGQPFRPRAALDQEGDILVVWDQVEGSSRIVRSRFLSSTGTLGAVERISKAGESGHSADLVVQRDGDAVIVWTGGLASSFQVDARARIRTFTGQLRPVLNPAAPNISSLDVRVGAGEGDQAVIIWRRDDFEDDYFYEARVLQMGTNQLGDTVVLSEENPDFAEYADEGAIAVNPSGSARVVWQRDDDVNVVQMTTGP